MRWLALRLIKFYQATISRVTAPACRYQPTCSNYGYEAILKYGLWKGGWMTLWRLLRCNPCSKGGYDPVP